MEEAEAATEKEAAEASAHKEKQEAVEAAAEAVNAQAAAEAARAEAANLQGAEKVAALAAAKRAQDEADVAAAVAAKVRTLVMDRARASVSPRWSFVGPRVGRACVHLWCVRLLFAYSFVNLSIHFCYCTDDTATHCLILRSPRFVGGG